MAQNTQGGGDLEISPLATVFGRYRVRVMSSQVLLSTMQVLQKPIEQPQKLYQNSHTLICSGCYSMIT